MRQQSKVAVSPEAKTSCVALLVSTSSCSVRPAGLTSRPSASCREFLFNSISNKDCLFAWSWLLPLIRLDKMSQSAESFFDLIKEVVLTTKCHSYQLWLCLWRKQRAFYQQNSWVLVVIRGWGIWMEVPENIWRGVKYRNSEMSQQKSSSSHQEHLLVLVHLANQHCVSVTLGSSVNVRNKRDF